MYRAAVKSQMCYDDIKWGSISFAELGALRRLQDRAVTIMKCAKIKMQGQLNR